MTRSKFNFYMECINMHLQENKKVNKALEFLASSSFISCEIGGHLLITYIKLLADCSGDKAGWVKWFVWDNDMGENKLEAGYDGEMKPICNYDDLFDLINYRKGEINE